VSTVSCEIPLHTGRGLNDREHWAARHRRVQRERQVTSALLPRGLPKLVGPGPYTVTLTRQAPSNGLDDDNLAGALKSVRDEVAAALGVNDGHVEDVRFHYAQRRGDWAVLIEVSNVQP
jgi:hypothetical protein